MEGRRGILLKPYALNPIPSDRFIRKLLEDRMAEEIKKRIAIFGSTGSIGTQALQDINCAK